MGVRNVRAVSASAALLVVMGCNWLDAKDASRARRIDDPASFVRREIITAFEQGKQVIPARLAVMRLVAADLPLELRPLVEKQDIEVRFRSHRIDVELSAQKLLQQIPALRTAPSVARGAESGTKSRSSRKRSTPRSAPELSTWAASTLPADDTTEKSMTFFLSIWSRSCE